MVGFDPTVENLRQISKPNDPISPSELSFPEYPDFSFSLPHPVTEFDCIEDWIMDAESFDLSKEGNPCPDQSDSKKMEFGCSENGIGVPVQGSCMEAGLDDSFADGSDGNEAKAEDVTINVENEGESGGKRIRVPFQEACVRAGVEDPSAHGYVKKMEKEVASVGSGLGSSIEEEMGKVSLLADSKSSAQVYEHQIVVHSEDSECLPKLKPVENGSGEMGNDEEDDDSSDLDSESDNSSSTSSSTYSSSSGEEEEDKEDEEGEMAEVGEVEEGEIKELNVVEIAGGSDEDEEGETKGPIRSKNEVEVLHHVPRVDVTLEPHHETLPVGVILTIMGPKAVVEGSEKHSPLSEGSILWITETRLPLGLVDEIFGPVKNPYYVVRYNLDQEVPAGIHEGTPVSFVAEFADHVLNDKNLFKKGYDASGEHDEEVSDEVEFSDDEKEAEYRRAQRTIKKSTNDRKRGNQEFVDRKKFQNKGGVQRNNQPLAHPLRGATGQLPNVPKVHAQTATDQHPGIHVQHAANQHPVPSYTGPMGQLPNVSNLLHTQPAAASYGCGSCTCSFGMGTPSTGVPASISPFVPVEQAICPGPQHLLPFNGIWTEGMPCEPQPQMTFPNGLPVNWMPYQQQNHHLHAQQMHTGFTNGVPIQQLFEPGQRTLPNVCAPHMQPSLFQGTSISWPGFVGLAGFNQVQPEAGIQGCHAHTSIEVEQGGVLTSGPFNKQRNEMRQPSISQENFSNNHHQFNLGPPSGRGSGRRPKHRGGLFSRGRGRR